MITYYVPRSYDYVQRTVIENRIYHIRLTYNARHDCWSISLYDENIDPIVEMMRIVPNFPLFKDITDYRLPKGRFGVSTALERLSAESFFNGDAELVYIEESDYEVAYAELAESV